MQEILTNVTRTYFAPSFPLSGLVHTSKPRGSCRKSTELHDKRHREIAELVQRILDGDEAAGVSSPLSTKKRKTRKCHAFDLYESPEDIDGDLETEYSWADSSTLNDDEPEHGRIDLLDGKENVSSKKTQKAERKVAKNQNRFRVITTADMKRIYEAIHPALDRNPFSGQPPNHHATPGLPNDATISANITFSTRTFRYSSLRPAIHTKKVLKSNGTYPNHSTTPASISATPSSHASTPMNTILHNLNISTSPPLHSRKERKSLLARLTTLIATDLECVNNEDRETMLRMAGYWRYVNRRTYNAMVRHNQLWDWETGAKLEEIEEENDCGDDEDGWETCTPSASSPDTIEDYGDDYELGLGVEELKLVDRESYRHDEDGVGNKEKPATARKLFVPSTKDISTSLTSDDDNNATPTQSTFTGKKDTRFRTTPTIPSFPLSPHQHDHQTPTHPPLPSIPNPKTAAILAIRQDPNNRFLLLADRESPTREIKGIVKVAKEVNGTVDEEEDGWIEVGRKGSKV